MFNKILVPFGNFEHIKQALPYAVDLATQFQAELILLRILPPLRVDLIPSTASLREARVITTELALQHLEEIAEPIREIGIKVKILTIEGQFQEEIKNFAKISGVSLIVLSARKPHGLFGKLFKSVSYRIICESDIPVIVVPDNFNKGNSIEKDFKLGMPYSVKCELCPYCFSKERFEIDSSRYYGNLDERRGKNKAIIVYCTNCKKIMGSITSYT